MQPRGELPAGTCHQASSAMRDVRDAVEATLQPVVKTSQRARLPPATGKCKCCKRGGELLACSFCTAVYHNSDACLGEAKLSGELAASACFPWACPACFKKGITSVQRIVLKPAGQRAAGVKRKRKQGGT